jgi:4-amino-4-deoxy-L-arabinose transferase-like glycosyltransferase
MEGAVGKQGERMKLLVFFRRRWALLVLLSASLTLRIFLFPSIVPRAHIDSITYLVFSDLNPARTPGYPVFIEIIQFFNDLFSITPDYLGYIIFFQMFFLGMINCYLIYALSKILTRSEAIAVSLGLIYNLDYFIIGFEFLILTETLSLTLLGLTLLFYAKIFAGKKSAPYLAGFFSVCLVLTRPSFAALFVCLVGISGLVHLRLSDRRSKFKKLAGPLAIFLLLNFAGILSWSWRNKVRHDYFGLSTLLPFQLGYFTQHFYWKYKMGSDAELDKYADILIQEKGQPFRVAWRFIEDLKMSDAEISRVLLRLNLKLIKENPKDYLRLLPGAASDYYGYSWYWTELQDRTVFERNRFLIKPLLFFFYFFNWVYHHLLALLIFILIIPAVLILASRKKEDVFHLACLLEGTIHYNFLISIFFTPGGINNLRYRLPVEPYIVLVFWVALFLLGRSIAGKFIKRPASRD